MRLQKNTIYTYLYTPSMYLGISQTKMTHVVVDQAEGKAPVHEYQAPLRERTRGQGIDTTHLLHPDLNHSC